MFCRLKDVKRVITSFPIIIENERQEREIDASFNLPKPFVDIIVKSPFWNGINDAIDLFDPICKCLGVLEADMACMSTTYACLIYIYVHISTVLSGESLDTAIKFVGVVFIRRSMRWRFIVMFSITTSGRTYL
jgi:hypothetical protein